MRRPLLVEALDALADGEARLAFHAAQALLDRIDEGIEDAEYEQSLARVLELAVQVEETECDATAAA